MRDLNSGKKRVDSVFDACRSCDYSSEYLVVDVEFGEFVVEAIETVDKRKLDESSSS
jgi:hypothetical protein